MRENLKGVLFLADQLTFCSGPGILMIGGIKTMGVLWMLGFLVSSPFFKGCNSSDAKGLFLSTPGAPAATFPGKQTLGNLCHDEGDSGAEEWLQHRGNCYRYFDKKVTWHEAEVECQRYGRGTHLASILSWPEALAVSKHISVHQKALSNVWIGLHDIRQNGKWRWADESRYSYELWMPRKPSNLRNSELCVELWRWTGFKQWNDTLCSQINSFICKH